MVNKKAVSTQTSKELAEATAKAEKKKHQEHIAVIASDASFASACTSELFAQNTFGKEEITASALSDRINKSIKKVQEGNLNELEGMLVGQAKALELMFMNLARRAASAEYVKNYQTYMNLALKAQNQSKNTIQALIELKYPKQVIVANQANITSGAQQVNNGTQTPANYNQTAHAQEKNQTEQNELLEHQKNESEKSQ